MIYLIGEMLVLLLAAAAIGFAAAWFLRGMRHGLAGDERTAALWSMRLSAAEAEYEAKSLAAEAATKTVGSAEAGESEAPPGEDD